MTIQTWLTQLQENGYRLTNARKAVVDVMVNTESALNPFEVYEQAKPIYSGIGLVTVYRTLEMLEELALIQRIHQPDGCNAYLPHVDGHQHLIICVECGKAEYFEGREDMDVFFDRVAGEHGYTISDHWLQLFGTCSECEH
ncbi:MAG: transcriptional repressor [Anaerolineales bacterium]|jgi:Fe2+ or Zn2+ uptake regulation protein